MLVPALTLPGARSDRVRGDHAGARVAFGRAEHDARGAACPDGSSSAAPSAVSSPAGWPATSTSGRSAARWSAGAASATRPSNRCEQLVVVVLRRGVDREHARSVADAEHLAPGELPVHVAGERRDESHLRHVRLLVEHRLVQVRDRPAQRDVGPEELGELGRGAARSSCCATCGTARAARRRRRRRGSRASSPRRRSRRSSRGARRSAARHRRPGRHRPTGCRAHTSSSEYVQTRPSNRFSHSWLPTASTVGVRHRSGTP